MWLILQRLKMTVRRSLFLALVLALIPLLALGSVAYFITRGAVEDEARAQADRMASLTATVVEQRLATAHGELAGMAEWPELILPALGVARGGDEAQRAAAGVALSAASTWWGEFSALTVHSRDRAIVTTSRGSATHIDSDLLEAALTGEVVAGGWSNATGTFQIARPLVGAQGDAAIVAEIPLSYLETPLARIGDLQMRLTGPEAVLFASGGDDPELADASADDTTVRVGIDGTPWAVEVARPASRQSERGIVLATLLAAVVLLSLAVIAVMVLGGSIVGRLRRLAATAEAIGEGRHDQRTGLGGTDEVAMAAGSFDRMADSLVTDISRRRQMETLLVQQALHDPLTGLANRAKLLDRLGDALLRSSRSGQSVGLLFCDLDGFKGVNDELGHSAGDDLLMLVADRFRSSVRPSDTVARFGGDEFVVLCSDLRHADDAIAVADRLRTAFTEPFQLGGTSVSTSASIGIAVGAGGTAAPDDLLRRADQAMYEAKSSGKARHVLYELTEGEEERTRSERAAEVRKAISCHELALHYQPIVELDDGRVAGHEAYVRWHHPVRGEVRPQELIDIATSAGLAAEVDLWVLGVALDELGPWRCGSDGEDEPVWTSVNLTPGSLATPGFAARVSEVLQSRDSRALSVVLEVSEAALSGEPGTVLSTLDELHDLGVGLAIDDFGTGHSSLDRLRRCPIDTIKIHQTLVHGLVADDDDRSAVQAIISMAEALDLAVIAEGVETEEQLAMLKTLGCRTAQGYLLASPVPVAELTAPVAHGASD